MSGIVRRHRLEALVPIRHRDRDAVGFGRRGHVLFLAAFARELEREAHDAIGAAPRECGLLHRHFILGAVEHAPADRRILALAVLAHDPEIDVARLAVRERALHAGHQAHRPQVHVLLEVAAKRNQQAPQRNVIGHRRRPAGGAEKHRVVRAHLLEPVLRHHAAVLRVVIAAPVEFVELELDAEFARRGFEHAHAFRPGFLADAVAGNVGDSVFLHDQSSLCIMIDDPIALTTVDEYARGAFRQWESADKPGSVGSLRCRDSHSSRRAVARTL